MSDVTPIRPGAPGDDEITALRQRYLRGDSPPPTMKELRDAIESIDGSSQHGFSKIAGIAHLARRVLRAESLSGLDRSALASAMDAIAYLAQDTMDSINIQAEQVGCNHKSER
jgi:hypothetical protein